MTYTPDKIKQEAQRLSGEKLVKLYELDATALGGSLYRFVSSVDATVHIVSISHDGLTATATTENPHTMSVSDSFNIANASPNEYNGDFTVLGVVSPTVFTYTLASAPSDPGGEEIGGSAMMMFTILNNNFTRSVSSGDATGDNILLTRLNNMTMFDGNAYSPLAFSAEGFEWNANGTLPTPTIKISNVNRLLAAAVISLNDLVGAKFTRIRTFRKHLDDGTDPDADATFSPDIFVINKKSAHNKVQIEFELATPIDQQGIKLPRRQVIRHTCTHTYRVWTGSAFSYTNATCPYAGTTYLDESDIVTIAATDKCGKQLASCKARFGNEPLPTRAFPGVGGF